MTMQRTEMENTEIMIGPLSAIPPGEGRNFDVRGERIAIFHARSGEVFAVQAQCPHRGGPLADGLVGGTTVICPLHGQKFDLTDGRPILGDCALKTYPAQVNSSGQITIAMNEQ